MQSIFRPKHQKLILQCYPSPKLSIAETKPNQAELSYLVFYASSRRTKLEKVGEFLLKKTSADISHKRVGHLKVTLYILQELIVKCSEDLGFMTPYVVSIMNDIVQLGDLSTCQLASEVFIIYCETLQPIQRQVFSSSVKLLKKFLNVISTFLGFASTKSNLKEWLYISLNTSLVIADYIDPSFSQFENENLINKSVNLILKTLSNHQADLSLVKISTGVSTSQINEKNIENIDEIATFALKSFFDTSSKRQLDEATKTVLQYIISNNNDLRWANNIMIICCKKAHIELRHRILIIFSNEIGNYVKKNQIDILDYLLKVTSNILNSTLVQFIGLPVLDILNKVIEFEQLMILHNEAHILKESYSDIIRSLSGRIYYNNQINDITSAVLSDYYYETTNNSNNLNDAQFYHYTEVIIDNIKDILTIAEKPDVALKISNYPLSIFNYIYLVFSFENFPKLRQQLQTIWLSLIEEFYKDNKDENYSIPNYESLITNNNDNNLCLLFDSIDKILVNDVRDEIKAQLSITISTLIKVFKINFLMNYLKYSSLWLADPKDFKYSLSLLILGLSSTIVRGAQTLAALADSKIAFSQNQNLWPEYISYQPSSKPSSNVLTNEELHNILNEIPEINQWTSKINIDEIPSFAKNLPKHHNPVILMSASNSVLSLPLGKQNSFGNMKTMSRGISHAHRTLSQSHESNVDCPANGNNGVVEENNNQIRRRDSSISATSTDIETNYTNEDFNFSAHQIPFGSGRSLRSGWSMRSGRNGRHINLHELKETKNSNIEETDLNRLVKTRTSGTFGRISSMTTVPNGNKENSRKNTSSGLAFAISGLNLDD
jgi:hypothetical protein